MNNLKKRFTKFVKIAGQVFTNILSIKNSTPFSSMLGNASVDVGTKQAAEKVAWLLGEYTSLDLQDGTPDMLVTLGKYLENKIAEFRAKKG